MRRRRLVGTPGHEDFRLVPDETLFADPEHEQWHLGGSGYGLVRLGGDTGMLHHAVGGWHLLDPEPLTLNG